jgi:hypothetical protein
VRRLIGLLKRNQPAQVLEARCDVPLAGEQPVWEVAAASDRGAAMTEYLIAFNDEWVPDLTLEQLIERSKTTRALIAEMEAAGVFVYSNGGLVDETPVFSVDASSGEPVFTDGPYVETEQHLGGFLVLDVPDESSARQWAGRVAVACGWPQEVRPFPNRARFAQPDPS